MDSSLCLTGLGHLDKAEALRGAGLCVGDDRTRLHSTERFEEVFELCFGGLARHVPNDQFHAASVPTDNQARTGTTPAVTVTRLLEPEHFPYRVAEQNQNTEHSHQHRLGVEPRIQLRIETIDARI